MKYVLSLPLEIPSKKNSRINTRSGRSFPNRKYTEWHDKAVLILRQQILPPKPIDAPVVVSVAITRGDNRRRDLDNALGSIMDLLQDVGVLADDKDDVVRVLRAEKMGVEKNAPKCIIRIIDA